MKISVEISREAYYRLKVLSVRYDGLTPHYILHRFAHDLTGSWENGGSDERDFAKNWFDRSFMPPENKPLTGRQLSQLLKYEGLANDEERQQREEFQKRVAAKMSAKHPDETGFVENSSTGTQTV